MEQLISKIDQLYDWELLSQDKARSFLARRAYPDHHDPSAMDRVAVLSSIGVFLTGFLLSVFGAHPIANVPEKVFIVLPFSTLTFLALKNFWFFGMHNSFMAGKIKDKMSQMPQDQSAKSLGEIFDFFDLKKRELNRDEFVSYALLTEEETQALDARVRMTSHDLIRGAWTKWKQSKIPLRQRDRQVLLEAIEQANSSLTTIEIDDDDLGQDDEPPLLSSASISQNN